MPDPIWTAEEIMAYVDGLGSPDVYWASFGYYPTTYEPMLRAAFDELVDARAAATCAVNNFGGRRSHRYSINGGHKDGM